MSTPLTTEQADHDHCPEDCEHPQPFKRDGKWLCGRCWFMGGVETEMAPCTEKVCP